MKGTSRLCIHSEVDLDEIWSKILRGVHVACTLWCDGLAPQEKSKSVSKRFYYDGSDSDPENLSPLSQRKEDECTRREKSSFDEAPSVPMFSKANSAICFDKCFY